jgi:hypothetical protein
MVCSAPRQSTATPRRPLTAFLGRHIRENDELRLAQGSKSAIPPHTSLAEPSLSVSHRAGSPRIFQLCQNFEFPVLLVLLYVRLASLLDPKIPAVPLRIGTQRVCHRGSSIQHPAWFIERNNHPARGSRVWTLSQSGAIWKKYHILYSIAPQQTPTRFRKYALLHLRT